MTNLPTAPAPVSPAAESPSKPPAAAPAQPPKGRPGARVLALGALAVVGLAAAFVSGALPRFQREQEAESAAAAASSSRPVVAITTARRSAPDDERVLPGNALPWYEASLYARTTGYLKRRLVDIGDQVKEGQLLAEISAPDVDDQLAQARANLAQAKANLPLAEANVRLAEITLRRDVKSGAGVSVPLEQIDQDKAQAETTAAQVEATRASIDVNSAAVQRFTDLQGFQKIIAPFDGVVTARNVDAGDLISADSPSTTREMFHVMQTDPLRVWVYVPQVFASQVQVGQEAVVYRREEPGRTFVGKVGRTADALDPATRTLLTEVHVDNKDGALNPGMFLQVKFTFRRQAPSVLIPGAALVTRSDGTYVAVLDGEEKVRYRKVTLGRDYGTEVEVLTGLPEGATVVVHPGDALPEGSAVQPSVLPTK
jgi:RND family efflux transporter MFP subunit